MIRAIGASAPKKRASTPKKYLTRSGSLRIKVVVKSAPRPLGSPSRHTSAPYAIHAISQHMVASAYFTWHPVPSSTLNGKRRNGDEDQCSRYRLRAAARGELGSGSSLRRASAAP